MTKETEDKNDINVPKVPKIPQTPPPIQMVGPVQSNYVQPTKYKEYEIDATKLNGSFR